MAAFHSGGLLVELVWQCRVKHRCELGREDSLARSSPPVVSPPSKECFVVIPCVDIKRDRCIDANVGGVEAARLEELPNRLVAMEVGEGAEHGAGEPERMTDAVVVVDNGDLDSRRCNLEQCVDGSLGDVGLVAEEEHEAADRRIDRGERGHDR